MNDVIEWLESEEGEEWSYQRHLRSRGAHRGWLELMPNGAPCGSTVFMPLAVLTWEIEYASPVRRIA